MDFLALNIAVVAPAKFDFQDLVCIELGLRWPASGTPSLRAEPFGGEDAELTWSEGGHTYCCEIQAKGRSTSEFSMATLAEYLAHFPDRQEKNCLLERLLADRQRLALFVASERCTDDVAALRTPVGWEGSRRAAKTDVSSGKGLSAALRYLSEAPDRARKRKISDLELRRYAHIATLSRTDPSALSEALQRVFIHENETAAAITGRLNQKLLAAGVPMDRLSDGIARLKHVVSEERPARPDIFGRLRTLVTELAPEQLAHTQYLPRGSETSLAEGLTRDGVILISGPPRVGKSWTAAELAGRLQKQGYEVNRSSHIDQADRFLSDPAAKRRAYLLEDPLGARGAVADVSKRISDLIRLAETLPGNRRLIVAQTEGPILEAFRRNNLADCRIGRFAWKRLDALSAEQAEALWRRDAADAGIAEHSVAKVAGIIRNKAELRDAGAIAYLASTFYRLASDASDGEIVAQARGDAVDFARELAERTPEAGPVLCGIAITTEAGSGIPDRELAFVIGGGNDRPSLDKSMGTSFPPDDEPTVAPIYAVPPELTTPAKDASMLLRRRRVILIEPGGLNFVHPYLRAGAQALVRPDLAEDFSAVAGQVARALAAPDPRVSLASARNLFWIAGTLADHPEGTVRALELGETGLQSVFPATRDACFEFLMAHADEIPPHDKRRLDRWVSAVDVEWEQIEEVAGILVVTSGAHNFLSTRPAVALTTIQPLVDAMVAGEVIDLGLPRAFAIIQAYEHTAKNLPKEVVVRLLSVESAVIRGRVSAAWLSRVGDDDGDILSRIGNDATPAVSNAVMDLLARSYNDLSDMRREAAVGILARHAQTAGSATILLKRLAKFGHEDQFGYAPPWPVFARLAPAALQNAPSAAFNDGRLVGTVEEAIGAGHGDALRPLFEVWAEKLRRELGTRLPDEWELAVSDVIFSVTDVDWRWPIVRALLDRPSTAGRLRIVANLVDRWTDLAGTERQDLLSVIAGGTGDEIWLLAAALTRRKVPPEVQAAAGGREDLLNLGPPDLLGVLGPALYGACLHVYLGSPQPLYWLGSHHAETAAWARAAIWSAGARERPLFALALAHEIARGGNTETLIAAIDQAQPGDLPEIFTVFLKQKISETGNWRKDVWTRLLERGAEADLLADWITQINKAAPLFLDGLRDIREWLGDSPHSDRIIRELESDLDAWTLVRVARAMAAETDPSAADPVSPATAAPGVQAGLSRTSSREEQVRLPAEVIRIWLETNPPRLHDTWHHVAKGLKSLGASEETLKWIDERRVDVLDRNHADRRPIRAEDQSPLLGWIGPK